MMSSFNARLRLPGQSKLPLGVEVDIQHERMTLTSGERTVAAWPIEKLEVVSHSDGFHIRVDGEVMVLNVADSSRFAAELGIDKHPSPLAGVQTSQRAQPEPSLGNGHQNGLPTPNGKGFSPRAVAETTPDAELLEDFQHRISDIAKALTSDSVSPAAAFAQWLKLLKEINRRHGQGSMPTDLYYRLNTQILDLIPDPAPVPAPKA
jgi:hypothetical protein